MRCAACRYTDTIEPLNIPVDTPEGATSPIIVQPVREEFKMVLLELPLRDGSEGIEMVPTQLFICPRCGTVRYEENEIDKL